MSAQPRYSDHWRAALLEGVAECRRTREARARAERAAAAIIRAGCAHLLRPILRDSKLSRALEAVARSEPGISAVRPKTIIIYWRRNPDVVDAAINALAGSAK